MDWQTLMIKPLSVNEAWKGKRYKTVKYSSFEKSALYLLKRMQIPDGKIKVKLKFYFSSTGSDIDNPIKPTLDILSKKYLMNDNRIYALNIRKKIVPKGQECFKFKITPLK